MEGDRPESVLGLWSPRPKDELAPGATTTVRIHPGHLTRAGLVSLLYPERDSANRVAAARPGADDVGPTRLKRGGFTEGLVEAASDLYREAQPHLEDRPRSSSAEAAVRP